MQCLGQLPEMFLFITIQRQAGCSSWTSHSSVVIGSSKCKSTSSLCCMRQGLLAPGRVMIDGQYVSHNTPRPPRGGGTLRQSILGSGIFGCL